MAHCRVEIAKSRFMNSRPTSTCHSSHAADLDAAHPDRSQVWLMYSVERFYDAPVIPGQDAASGLRAAHSGTIMPPTCEDGELKFSVFNSFKEATEKPGAFDVLLHNMGNTTRKPTVASGTFLFAAHWRPTLVTTPVHLQGGPDEVVVHDVELVVRNHRGVTTSYNLTCTSLDKHAGSSLDNTTNASRRA